MAINIITNKNEQREIARFITLCLLSYSQAKNISESMAAKLFVQYDVTGFLYRHNETEGGLAMINIIEDIDELIANRK
jgi:predicted transcriptional regulator